MKKLLLLLLVASLCALTACGGDKDAGAANVPNEPSPPPVKDTVDTTDTAKVTDATTPEPEPEPEPKPAPVEATDAPIDNGETYIGMMEQSYDGNNICEIPMILYDGENPQLAVYNGHNPEIDSLNNAVKSGVMQMYNNFTPEGDDGRIEIRAYPFTSERYLQFVITHVEYPTYGTDGELYSYNFDKQANAFLNLGDVMADMGITTQDVTDAVGQLHQPEYDGETVGEVDVAGFLMQPDGLVQLLLYVTVEIPGAEPWRYFYCYTPSLKELIHMNAQCLFDPSDMDQMDPPLSYQGGETASFLQPVFDTEGLDDLGGGRYSADGVVFYEIGTLLGGQYLDNDGLQAWMTDRYAQTGVTIRDAKARDDTALSQQLTHPARRVSYTMGSNEDTVLCDDAVVYTDTAVYILHTQVAADFYDEYKEDIDRRLGTIWLQ